ncbi:hypothetical protein GUJ93_ZPchr0007g5717 [Zizania palustris]|uniref:Uncharacterized protein n=1 Tax=Zizania palustris TaxID=103762 RepID=A0A8J5TF38_ZIZPA|nr:hypothetical protein GUJ93_ZPchr0007g5717 [Zizania palustris]
MVGRVISGYRKPTPPWAQRNWSSSPSSRPPLHLRDSVSSQVGFAAACAGQHLSPSRGQRRRRPAASAAFYQAAHRVSDGTEPLRCCEVVSKLLPPYENRFLSAIQNDRQVM